MPAAVLEVETLDDDEFDALEHAVRAAELQSLANKAKAADIEDLGLQPINLVSLRANFMRLRAKARLQTDISRPSREGISLSVTDITSAQWCGLQLAYQTASGAAKRQTAAMAQGSGIHEGLELAIVDKIAVTAEHAEDVLAISLLNAVSCIRQLVTQGETRELRVFSRLKGQWVVGVIDGLKLDPATHRTSLLETKTRNQAKMPPPEQIDSARLQVMIYRQLYDAFRNLTLADITSYLYQHSTSGVGLQQDRPLGLALMQFCTDFFRPDSQQQQSQQQEGGQQQQPQPAAGQQQQQPQPAAGQQESQQLQQQHERGQQQEPHQHTGRGHFGQLLGQQAGQAPLVPAESVDAALLSTMHISEEPESGTQPLSQPALPPTTQGQQQPAQGSEQPPVSHAGQPHTPGQPAQLNGHTSPLNTAATQPEHRNVQDNGHAASSTPADLNGHTPSATATKHLSSHQNSHTVMDTASASSQGNGDPTAPTAVVTSTTGAAEPGADWTLADCVRLLYETLQFLPPAGEAHELEYLWQEDPKVVIGREAVTYDEGWVGSRLDAALALWLGWEAPKPVPKEQTWKCKFCDFRATCRKYNAQNPLSDPFFVAGEAIRKREARAAIGPGTIEVVAQPPNQLMN